MRAVENFLACLLGTKSLVKSRIQSGIMGSDNMGNILVITRKFHLTQFLSCVLFRRAQAISWLSLVFISGIAQGESPEDSLDLSQVQRHLRFIASDELGGRMVGTLGNQIAARYISEHFRSFGVQIVPGMKDYFQKVSLELVDSPKEGFIQMGATTLRAGTDFVSLGSTLEAGSYQWVKVFLESQDTPGEGSSDYRDLQVDQKVVIGFLGTGKDRETALRKTLRLAAERGAVALMEVYKGDNWERLRQYLMRSRIRLQQSGPWPPNAPDLPHFIVNGDSIEGAAWREEDIVLDVRGIEKKQFSSSNVVGVIPGTDKRVAQEFVLLVAHYDHIGTSLLLPGASQDDYIFNGARDNGIGVVALISAAKILSHRPPRRPVIVLATTAEEQGLLGSKHYVSTPVVPLKDTVFALNVDAAGFDSTDAVTILGLNRTTAAAQIRKSCLQYGLEPLAGPPQVQSLFTRSDNFIFAKSGIPAPTFTPVIRSLHGKSFQHYHQPSDEVEDDFSFEYLLRFSQAFSAAARSIADSDKTPRWVPGDPLRGVSLELYGDLN